MPICCIPMVLKCTLSLFHLIILIIQLNYQLLLLQLTGNGIVNYLNNPHFLS